MAGIGPGPFAAMMLADHGARVIRVERPGNLSVPNDPLTRNRESIALDLKTAGAKAIVGQFAGAADGLIEGYRPGVMESLGLGPDDLLQNNAGLVYGRVTGWGQTGPLVQEPGHDINYLGLTGLLSTIGEPDRPPVPPLNLVADFAGGGMMLAFGMIAALLEVQRGGVGQVVDTAMTDGAALIGSLIYGMRAAGIWRDGRASNLLDGGDAFYGCYRCADGRDLALGAIEPKFRRQLAGCLGIEEPVSREQVAAVIATRSRDEWTALFFETDACATPVLTMAEAPDHPHNVARRTFLDIGGVVQPAPAPRYSGTPTDEPRPPRPCGADGADLLAEFGFSENEIAGFRNSGVLL